MLLILIKCLPTLFLPKLKNFLNPFKSPNASIYTCLYIINISLISGITSSIAFSFIQFIITDKSLNNSLDLIITFIQFIIFFTVWVYLQNKLLNLSEKQSNKDIE